MQNATAPMFDAIRLLANDNFDAGNKISCIFIGTSELFDKLRLAINESVRQRITYFHHLDDLSFDDSKKYIEHCLSQVGAVHPVFAIEAIQFIHDAASGSIRMIKQLANNAMVIASEKGSSNVALDHARQASGHSLLPRMGVTL